MPLTVSHAKSNTIGDFTGTVTVFNSAGATTSAVASNLILPSDWNSAHQMTVDLSASEFAPAWVITNGLSSSTNASSITIGMGSDAWWEPFFFFNTAVTQMSVSSMSYGTWYIDGPHEVDQAIGKGQLNFFVAMPANFLGGAAYSAASTGSVSRSATFEFDIALFTQGGGASTSRLESLWTTNVQFLASNIMNLSTANTSSGTLTNRLTISFPAQWDTAGNVTYSSSSTSATSNLSASTMASTRYDSLISNVGAYISGSFMVPFGFSTTMPPGIYWLGRKMSTTSSSTGTAGGIGAMGTYNGQASILGGIQQLGGAYKRLGLSVSNSSTNFHPFHGFYASSSTGVPAIINTSDMRATTGKAYLNYFVSTY